MEKFGVVVILLLMTACNPEQSCPVGTVLKTEKLMYKVIDKDVKDNSVNALLFTGAAGMVLSEPDYFLVLEDAEGARKTKYVNANEWRATKVGDSVTVVRKFCGGR